MRHPGLTPACESVAYPTDGLLTDTYYSHYREMVLAQVHGRQAIYDIPEGRVVRPKNSSPSLNNSAFSGTV